MIIASTAASDGRASKKDWKSAAALPLALAASADWMVRQCSVTNPGSRAAGSGGVTGAHLLSVQQLGVFGEQLLENVLAGETLLL